MVAFVNPRQDMHKKKILGIKDPSAQNILLEW